MVDTAVIKLEAFQISPVFDPNDEKLQKNKPNGKVKLVSLKSKELEIDFIGFHTSLVNAYRRIILAEVPTMAIEKVFMYNNTSIVQDEVLCHRLGLVPLKVDPRLFEFRSKKMEEDCGPQNTLKFSLKVKCTKDNKKLTQNKDGDISYVSKNVCSSALNCELFDSQKSTFPEGSLGVLHDDILLAKLVPGQEINLEAEAVKGIGCDHAKFQPGMAWYRFLPSVELTRQVEGEDAHLLQSCFSPGVIELINDDEGRTIASVKDARYDSCSRNVFQYDSIKNSVVLTQKTDHIIFHIESHSFLSSASMLSQAVCVMIGKCDDLLNELAKYEVDDSDE